jgi:FkbM family methyltransferase
LERTARLFDGQRMRVDPFDSVGDAIFREGCYEPESVQVFERLLHPGARVVDAGAHIGQYTLVASRAVGPGGEVHAFEPDPATARLLRANVALNRCGNVRVNELALSDQDGTATLHLAAATNIGGNSLGVTDCSTDGCIEVRTRTLDAYLGSGPGIDLIKADVEGAEWLLLRGAQRVLARAAPHLILEFSVHTRAFGYERADLADWLAARGYRLYAIGPLPLAPLTIADRAQDWYNVLAVHADRTGAVTDAGVLAA